MGIDFLNKKVFKLNQENIQNGVNMVSALLISPIKELFLLMFKESQEAKKILHLSHIAKFNFFQ